MKINATAFTCFLYSYFVMCHWKSFECCVLTPFFSKALWFLLYNFVYCCDFQKCVGSIIRTDYTNTLVILTYEKIKMACSFQLSFQYYIELRVGIWWGLCGSKVECWPVNQEGTCLSFRIHPQWGICRWWYFSLSYVSFYFSPLLSQ